MAQFTFQQVDVFAAQPLRGNPLAVVVGADALTDTQMGAFANWTNLSETTFLLRPRAAGADYRVRIFTPQRELPFAGHPTLGSCHVWLASGGIAKGNDLVQECEGGLVRIRRGAGRLAFEAPTLRRDGPLDADLQTRVTNGLRLTPDAIVATSWVDTVPAGWLSCCAPVRTCSRSVRTTWRSQGCVSASLGRGAEKQMARTPSSRCAPSLPPVTRIP